MNALSQASTDPAPRPDIEPVSLAEPDTPISHGPLHPLSIWRRIRKDKAALLGLGIVMCVALIAAAAPWIAPYRPNQRDLTNMNAPPFWASRAADVGSGPVQRNFFGRDVRGQDV